MTRDLDAEVLVVLQRGDHRIERRIRNRLEQRLVERELDPLRQFELVWLDDHLVVDRAAVVGCGSSDVGADVILVEHAVAVAIGFARLDRRGFGHGRSDGDSDSLALALEAGSDLQADADAQDLRVAVVETDAIALEDVTIAGERPKPQPSARIDR